MELMNLYIFYFSYSGGRGGYGGGSSRGGYSSSSYSGSGGGFGNSWGGSKTSQPGGSLRKPNWDMQKLPKFEKNFYSEHPSVRARSEVLKKSLFPYCLLQHVYCEAHLKIE